MLVQREQQTDRFTSHIAHRRDARAQTRRRLPGRRRHRPTPTANAPARRGVPARCGSQYREQQPRPSARATRRSCRASLRPGSPNASISGGTALGPKRTTRRSATSRDFGSRGSTHQVSRSRSNAPAVPLGGYLRSGRQLAATWTVDQLQIAVTDEVEIPHGHPGAVGHLDGGIGVERDERRLVLLELDAVDRPDPHPPDPHRLPDLQSGGILEDGRVVVGRSGLVLPEDEEQARGQDRHDDSENAELDEGRA